MKKLIDKDPVKFMLIGMTVITIVVNVVAFMVIRHYKHDTAPKEIVPKKDTISCYPQLHNGFSYWIGFRYECPHCDEGTAGTSGAGVITFYYIKTDTMPNLIEIVHSRFPDTRCCDLVITSIKQKLY